MVLSAIVLPFFFHISSYATYLSSPKVLRGLDKRNLCSAIQKNTSHKRTMLLFLPQLWNWKWQCLKDAPKRWVCWEFTYGDPCTYRHKKTKKACFCFRVNHVMLDMFVFLLFATHFFRGICSQRREADEASLRELPKYYMTSSCTFTITCINYDEQTNSHKSTWYVPVV